MPTYVTRLGKTTEADDVFFAWTSGNLAQMRRALVVQTNLIDRHFLLMNLVDATYKDRDSPEMRRLCKEIGLQHLSEFAAIAPALKEEMGGFLPRVTSFVQLSTLLVEDGDVLSAIDVCERAQTWGLHDGTKGNFAARIQRLKKMCKSQP